MRDQVCGMPEMSLSPEFITCDVYKGRRNERQNFKNIHVAFTELPMTPAVSNIRNSKWSSQRRKRKREDDSFWVARKRCQIFDVKESFKPRLGITSVSTESVSQTSIVSNSGGSSAGDGFISSNRAPSI